MLDKLPPVYVKSPLDKVVTCPGVYPHKGGLAVENGPDGNTGYVFGGIYAPVEQSLWHKTPAGYWLRKDPELTPSLLIKDDVSPRIRKWVAVRGASQGHAWAVPLLLTKVGDAWVSAVERVYTPTGWDVPEEHQGLIRRIIAAATILSSEAEVENNMQELTEIAVKILQQAHYVDLDLLAVYGWLTEDLVLRTIVATAGIEEAAE